MLNLNFSIQIQGHRYYVGCVFGERAEKRDTVILLWNAACIYLVKLYLSVFQIIRYK